MLVRYPEKIKPGTKVPQMVLNIDLAPSVLEMCDATALQNIHGMSWAGLVSGKSSEWRDAWYYEYNYEKQFPYTPNVRGVRTDRWKYVHYPHGDGGPDRHKSELYDLKNDPGELKNLIDDPTHKDTIAALKKQLQMLMKQTGALPDKMPVDEGIKKELPEESIQ
jgi:N-acetylglucosamine-6-sulfatase